MAVYVVAVSGGSGAHYARRLLQAGVTTELHCFAGACHGFDTAAPATAVARRAIAEQVVALRRGLGVRPA